MLSKADIAQAFGALMGMAALLWGCADDSPLSGRRMLEDLERAHIPHAATVGPAQMPNGDTDLPNSGPISLADLLRAAEARSPSLAAARSGVGVASGRRWQASLFPNPRADVLVEDFSWRDGASEAKTTVGITQPIIIGNRRQTAMDAADAAQAARLAEVEAQRRAVFGDISAEYIHLVSIHEQRQLYSELRELASRTLTAASTRFEARAVPETDVIRPRVEVYRINAALGRLAHEEVASARRLGLLIGGITVDPSRIRGDIQPDPDGLDAQALQAMVRLTHPLLVVADREVDAAAARLEQVRAERTPDVDIRVAAGYRGGNSDGIVELGAGMIIPLWNARQGDILSTRFELMRARQQRVAIENDLLARLATLIGEYEAGRTQLIAFRNQIVPDAQRAFEQTGEGYRGGRSTFLDLLDTQRTLTEARITLAELSRAVAAARARIMQVVGSKGLVEAAPRPASEINVPSTTQERSSGAEVKP